MMHEGDLEYALSGAVGLGIDGHRPLRMQEGVRLARKVREHTRAANICRSQRDRGGRYGKPKRLVRVSA